MQLTSANSKLKSALESDVGNATIETRSSMMSTILIKNMFDVFNLIFPQCEMLADIFDILTAGFLLIILFVIMIIILGNNRSCSKAAHFILFPVLFFVIFLMIFWIAVGLTMSVFNCQALSILFFIVIFLMLCWNARSVTSIILYKTHCESWSRLFDVGRFNKINNGQSKI